MKFSTEGFGLTVSCMDEGDMGGCYSTDKQPARVAGDCIQGVNLKTKPRFNI